VLDAILMERAGTPAIAIVTDPFRATGEAMASAWGMAGYQFLATPHPIANLSDKELEERADRLLEAVEAWLERRGS
jgi:acetyl-CoA carboxylase beta subunit